MSDRLRSVQDIDFKGTCGETAGSDHRAIAMEVIERPHLGLIRPEARAGLAPAEAK